MEALHVFAPHLKPETAQAKVDQVERALGSGKYSGFVRIDIVGFYDSLNHSVLSALVEDLVRSPKQAAQIMRVAESPTVAKGRASTGLTRSRGVPQGVAISGLLGELYLHALDRQYRALPDVSYFRYVDDVIILCDYRNVGDVWRDITSKLTRIGLDVHPPGTEGKSELGNLKDPFEYLGYRFEGSKITVRSRNVSKLESSILRVFTQYKYAVNGSPKAGFSIREWGDVCDEILTIRLNLLVTGCIFDGKRRGWLAYFLRINDQTLLKRLDLLVRAQRSSHAVPPHLRIRSFVRAHWSWRAGPASPRKREIPNFDLLDDGEMRRYLRRLFLVPESRLRGMSDEDVKRVFKQRMNKIVVELEQDTSELS